MSFFLEGRPIDCFNLAIFVLPIACKDFALSSRTREDKVKERWNKRERKNRGQVRTVSVQITINPDWPSSPTESHHWLGHPDLDNGESPGSNF